MASPPVQQRENVASSDMMVLLHAVVERARNIPVATVSEEPSSNEEGDDVAGGGSEGSHPPAVPAIPRNMEASGDRGIPPSVYIRASQQDSSAMASDQQIVNSVSSIRKVTVDSHTVLPNTPSTSSTTKAPPMASDSDNILQDSYANFLLNQLHPPIAGGGSLSTNGNTSTKSPLLPSPTNQETHVTNEILRLLGITTTAIQPQQQPPAQQQQVSVGPSASSNPSPPSNDSKKSSSIQERQAAPKRPLPEFPGSVKVTCRARGMPPDHCSLSAFFWIHPELPHGADLLCCYPACRAAGVKFRYCKVCKVPAAKRSFLFRHSHINEFQENSPSQEEGVDISPLMNGRDEDLGRPAKKCRTIELASSQNSVSSSGNEDSSREGMWRRLLYERPEDEDDDQMSMWLLRVMQVSKSSR